MSNDPMEQAAAVDRTRGGGRRGLLVVGALLLLLLVTFVIVSAGDDRTQIATGSDCPLDLGDCTGLAPDTTSTSLGTPDTTTSTVALPGVMLTGTSGTLRLEVTLEPPELLTAQILRIHVRATDVPGSYFNGGSDYGDGIGGGRPQAPILECKPQADRPATLRPGERTWTLTHAYRLPGAYPLRIEVASSRCADQDDELPNHGNLTATVEAVVTVGKGLQLANGPEEPLIDLAQLPAFIQPGDVALNVGTKDPDGWIEHVDLDWGDGSPHHVIQRPLSSCVDPLKTWPGPTEVIEAPTHRYPRAGAFTARATVTSVACDGSNVQTVAQTIQINAP